MLGDLIPNWVMGSRTRTTHPLPGSNTAQHVQGEGRPGVWECRYKVSTLYQYAVTWSEVVMEERLGFQQGIFKAIVKGAKWGEQVEWGKDRK